jgi:hypothetical protein
MRNLSEEELAWIEQRAELQFRFGDPTALRPEDVADLIVEVKELHAQRRHLIALNRQRTGYLEAP